MPRNQERVLLGRLRKQSAACVLGTLGEGGAVGDEVAEVTGRQSGKDLTGNPRVTACVLLG